MPRRLPTDFARAGAMTTANSTGVSRGDDDLPRRVGAEGEPAAGQGGQGAESPGPRWRREDDRFGNSRGGGDGGHGSPCLRGSGGDAAAGEPEVHVIER